MSEAEAGVNVKFTIDTAAKQKYLEELRSLKDEANKTIANGDAITLKVKFDKDQVMSDFDALVSQIKQKYDGLTIPVRFVDANGGSMPAGGSAGVASGGSTFAVPGPPPAAAAGPIAAPTVTSASSGPVGYASYLGMQGVFSMGGAGLLTAPYANLTEQQMSVAAALQAGASPTSSTPMNQYWKNLTEVQAQRRGVKPSSGIVLPPPPPQKYGEYQSMLALPGEDVAANFRQSQRDEIDSDRDEEYAAGSLRKSMQAKYSRLGGRGGNPFNPEIPFGKLFLAHTVLQSFSTMLEATRSTNVEKARAVTSADFARADLDFIDKGSAALYSLPGLLKDPTGSMHAEIERTLTDTALQDQEYSMTQQRQEFRTQFSGASSVALAQGGFNKSIAEARARYVQQNQSLTDQELALDQDPQYLAALARKNDAQSQLEKVSSATYATPGNRSRAIAEAQRVYDIASSGFGSLNQSRLQERGKIESLRSSTVE